MPTHLNDFPMSPHVRLLVSWLLCQTVGLSVCDNFLKGRNIGALVQVHKCDFQKFALKSSQPRNLATMCICGLDQGENM